MSQPEESHARAERSPLEEAAESIRKTHAEESAKREDAMAGMQMHASNIMAGMQAMAGHGKANVKEGMAKAAHPMDEEKRAEAHAEAERERRAVSEERTERGRQAEAEAEAQKTRHQSLT